MKVASTGFEVWEANSEKVIQIVYEEPPHCCADHDNKSARTLNNHDAEQRPKRQACINVNVNSPFHP